MTQLYFPLLQLPLFVLSLSAVYTLILLLLLLLSPAVLLLLLLLLLLLHSLIRCNLLHLLFSATQLQHQLILDLLHPVLPCLLQFQCFTFSIAIASNFTFSIAARCTYMYFPLLLPLHVQPSIKLQLEPPESGVQTTQLGRNLGIILGWQSRLFRIALNISVFGLEIN